MFGVKAFRGSERVFEQLGFQCRRQGPIVQLLADALPVPIIEQPLGEFSNLGRDGVARTASLSAGVAGLAGFERHCSCVAPLLRLSLRFTQSE